MGKGPKRIVVFALGGLMVAACGYLAILLYAAWDFRSINVTIPIQQKNANSEAFAIEYSSNALIKAGKDIASLEPRTWNGTNFFAQNTYNTNSGYILWGRKGELGCAFSVQLAWDNDVVHCGVGKTK